MSIPIEDDDTRFERFGRVIRLAPLFVAVILAALWIAGTPDEVPDFRLSAPVVARPGSSVGLRAWHIDRGDDGYTVIRAPSVTVELRNQADMLVSSIELRSSQVQGVEGSLEIPSNIEGEMSLVARAKIAGDEVIARRTLYVREGIDSRLPAGREVNAFQVYELGVLRSQDPMRAPSTLDPRIEEGVCAPDLECTLTVWVGQWTGRIRLRPLSGVDIPVSELPSAGGFVRFPLTVRGQEGRVAVDALGDDGIVQASRDVRLPLVPGAIVAQAAVDHGRLRVEWHTLDASRPVLLDVFDEHRWVGAISLAPDDPAIDMLPPGIWRLQIRTDLFSDNTAAVVYVAIDDPEGEDALRAAASAVVAGAAREGLDPLAMAVLDRSFSGDSQSAVRALFALPSFNVVSVGLGVSARVDTDEDLRKEQDRRRWQAAGAILLIGFVVSLVLLLNELRAHARARRILEGLPSDEAPRPTHAPTGRGLWAFVLLVFVMMAVLALSKRWF